MMTDISDAGAEAGGEGAVADQLQGEGLDAGSPAEGHENQEGGEPAEGEGEADQAKAKAPLPPEEVEKRWRQTQGALKASRSELRALRAEIAEFRASRQQPQVEEVAPDPNEDPIGALEWMQKQFAAQAEKQQAQQKETAEQAATRMIGERVTSLEADFVASQPDYYDAINHLRQSRANELLELGADPDEVDGMVSREILAGVRDALNQGLNPARVAYSYAKQRGFKPAGQSAEASLDRIAEGQKAAKSLSGVGGGAKDLTPEYVSTLKGAAFDTAFAKLQEQEQRRHG
jgi:hypothetical protein